MINMYTKNKSFKNMRNILYDQGVEDPNFMLELKDDTLIDIPEDPSKWNKDLRKRIDKECRDNFWFFVREIVRIPTSENLRYSDPYECCPRFILRYDTLRLFFAYVNNINVTYRTNKSESLINALAILLIYEYSIKNETSFLNYDMKIPRDIDFAVEKIHELNTRSSFINTLMLDSVVRSDPTDAGYDKFIFDIFNFYGRYGIEDPNKRDSNNVLISLDPIYDGTYSDSYIAKGYREYMHRMDCLKVADYTKTMDLFNHPTTTHLIHVEPIL